MLVKFAQDWKLLFLSLSLIGGFSLATLFEQQALTIILTGILVIAFCGIFNQSKTLLLVVGILGIFLGTYFYANFKAYPVLQDKLDIPASKAVVVGMPKKTSSGGQQVNIKLEHENAPLRLKVFYKNASLKYGDTIEVAGEVPQLSFAQDFPNKKYLYNNKIDGVLYSRQLVKLDEKQIPNKLIYNLYNLRSYIVELSSKVFPNRSAGVINAMIFGDTSLIYPEVEEVFLRTGTTHLLVVSGANVLLIAWIIRALLNPLGVQISRLLSILVVCAFVIFTGGEPSIIRAGIIFILLTFAELLGRKPHYPTLIAATACAMAIFNPWILLYNITFQLSFGAVIGLILFSKKLEQMIGIPILKETMAPTIAASIFTLPIIIYHFSTISTVFLIANILVVPLVPFITVTGIAALALPPLKALAWIADGIVILLLKILNSLANFDFSFIVLDNKGTALFIVCTVVVYIIYYLGRYKEKI